MSDVAIRVEGLGKRYRIGPREQYKALRDVLTDTASAPLRGLATLLKGGRPAAAGAANNGHIWALKDVSFEIKQGEVAGIIGRNGAGKSTLLKILSRITEPTEGYADVYGRVGSLLEVGTGFHPELTGRENIYLNGAILGMRKAEIDRKFDEIVAFAEIEAFLDTPVKHYSSGMYVRLAFAVASHLEPEILLVDEVLAVGDAAFQKKCLGKMGDVTKEGRTVLFVSHNLGVVQALAGKTVLLGSGGLVSCGKTADAVETYLRGFAESVTADTDSITRISPHHGREIRIFQIQPVQPTELGFYFGDDLVFEIRFKSLVTRRGLRLGATIADVYGQPVMSTFSPPLIEATASESSKYELAIVDSRLAPGTYTVSVSIGEGQQDEAMRNYDIVRPGPSFAVCSVARHGPSVFRWRRDWGAIAHPSTALRRVP